MSLFLLFYGFQDFFKVLLKFFKNAGIRVLSRRGLSERSYKEESRMKHYFRVINNFYVSVIKYTP